MDINRLCKIYTCTRQSNCLDKYSDAQRWINTAGVEKSDGSWIEAVVQSHRTLTCRLLCAHACEGVD